jgi:hypothetical protein
MNEERNKGLLKSKLFWVVVLVSAVLARGMIVRIVLLPWRVHASWVHDVATIDSPLQLYRELPADYTSRFTQAQLQKVKEANRQKWDFVKAFRAREGKRGLRTSYSTPEGDRIDLWFLTENGQLTVVHDGSRDQFGSFPFVTVHHADDVVIGYWSNANFVTVTSLMEDVLLEIKTPEGWSL